LAVGLQIQLNKTSMSMVQREYANFVKKLSDTYKISVNLDTTKFNTFVTQQSTGMNSIKTNTEKNLSDMSRNVTNYQNNMGLQLDKLQQKYAGVWSNPKAQESINTFKTNLSSMTNMTMKGDLTNQFRSLNMELGELSKTSRSAFIDGIENALIKVPIWLLACGSIAGAIRGIGEAFEFTKEQSATFTNLRMEMTDSNLKYGEVTESANKYAVSLNSTTDSVMKAIGVFGTYTSSMDDVLQKSQAAVVLSNISGQDIESTSDDVMAALQQYQLGADQAMRIADTISAASRLLQIDYPKAISGISNGLKVVGGVAHDSQMSLEKTEAIIGKIMESTRSSGTQAGTGLKTILSRFSRFGDETDPDTWKKLQQNLHDYAHIEMLTKDNVMIPTDKVLQQLAASWTTLSDVQRNEIIQNGAGVFQRNKFLAIMNNYKGIMEVATAAENSNGVAMQKNQIRSEGIAGALDRLREQWEKLYLSVLSPDKLTPWINFGTALMTASNNVHGLEIALIALSGVFTGVMIKALAPLAVTFTGFVNSVKMAIVANAQHEAALASAVPVYDSVTLATTGLVSSLEGLSFVEGQLIGIQTALNASFEVLGLTGIGLAEETAVMTAGFGTFAVAEEAVIVQTSLFTNTMVGLGVVIEATGGPIIWLATAIGLLVAASWAYSKAQDEANKKQNEAIQKNADQAKSTNELMASVEDLRGKTELNNGEQERLKNTAAKLIEIYPQLKGKIDNTKLSYDALANAAGNASNEMLKAARAAYTQELSKYAQTFDAEREAKAMPQGSVLETKASYIETLVTSAKIDGTASKARLDELKKNVDELQSAINTKYMPNSTPDAGSGGGGSGGGGSGGGGSGGGGSGGGGSGGSKTGSGSSSKTEDILAQYKSYQQAISDTVHELNILQSKNKLISEDDYPAQEKAQQSLIDQYKKQQEAIRQYGLQLHAAIDSGKYSGDELQKLKDELDKESESWWSLQDNIYDASKAITDFGTKAKEAAIKALDASDAAKGLKEEMSAIKDLSDAEKDSISSYYDAQIQAVEDEISALKEKNDQLDKAAKTQELLLNLQKAQTALANVQKEHNVRLYTGQGSTGWEWVSDPSKLADAQKSVDDATKAMADDATKNAQDAAEKILSDKKAAFEAEKKVETDAYNVRKDKFDAFQKLVEEMQSTHDAISKDALNTFLGSLTDSEKESYGNRIAELTNFINSWNAQITAMKTPSTISGGGGSNSYDYSGGSSAFETDADRAQADANRQHYKETGQLTTGNKVAGAKASGGSVSAGSTYQVNEVGLEGFMSSHSGKDFFTPLTSGGTIITADQMSKRGSGSGDTIFQLSGDLSFPSIKNGNDAQAFIKELAINMRRKAAMGV